MYQINALTKYDITVTLLHFFFGMTVTSSGSTNQA